jgi:hypothetical protein
MANYCGISGGITFDCDTKAKASGGNKQDFWIGNIQDVDKASGLNGLTIDGSGYVTAIAFESYKGLYRFTGTKLGNQNSDDIARNDNGIANFPVSAIFTCFDVTPDDSEKLQELGNADGVFVIMQSSSDLFRILGFDLGLTLESAPRSTGAQPSDSAGRIVTLTGNEPKLPYFFFDTKVSDTIAKLESYEV